MKRSRGKKVFALIFAGTAFAVAANSPRALAQNSESQNTVAPSTAPVGVPATSLTPAEILRRADQLTNIRAPGSTPFHLKAHFIATGPVEFTGEGDYEETWLAPDKWVEEIQLGAYHSIETRDGAKHSFQANQAYRPRRVLQATSLLTYHRQVLQAPDLLVYDSTEKDPALQRAVETDKASGDIRLVSPKGVLPVDSILSFHSDGTPAQSGQHEWSDYEEFSGKQVARILQESNQLGETLLRINITQLEALPVPASLPEVALPNAVASSDPGPYQVGKDSVTAPKLTYAPDPKYPVGLAKKHVGGLVVVSLMVDTNGVAREAEAVYATNPLFIPAAVKAVSRYKFEPARRNGALVQVRVNVEVSFKLD